MIVIKLQGGLGNQMFQFAIGSILALKNKSDLKIDNRFFENNKNSEGFTPREFELCIFDNQYHIATVNQLNRFFELSKLNRLKKNYGLNFPKVFLEPNLGYHKPTLYLKTPVYLEGYFQSYRYFEGKEDFVKNLFSFSKMNLDKKNVDLLDLINSKVTVAVHIRRGDYVNDAKTQQFHGTCSKDYYFEAIKRFEKKRLCYTYIFFSDDIEWVKENFKDLKINRIFVDKNKGSESWKDMYLMSQCTHNIIANSSFSWWGCYLNDNKDKIVCAPNLWFANCKENEKAIDLIPESWIRI